jgi:hypothetical protein
MYWVSARITQDQTVASKQMGFELLAKRVSLAIKALDGTRKRQRKLWKSKMDWESAVVAASNVAGGYGTDIGLSGEENAIRTACGELKPKPRT